MILLIDNYDSFTFNVLHLIGALGHEVDVRRNDSISAEAAIALQPEAIIISPGPCTPDDAGICLDLVGKAAQSSIPIFGICLGMQAIAQHFGAKIERAEKLMHGKVSGIRAQSHPLFKDVPNEFQATRYHSLVARKDTLGSEIEIIAGSTDDDEIMAIAHRTAPIAGVQFHPESIASEFGSEILKNFLTFAADRK